MAGFSRNATKLITEFAQKAGKSVDELQDVVVKGIGGKGNKINVDQVREFFNKNPIDSVSSSAKTSSKVSQETAEARRLRRLEIENNPNASPEARARATAALDRTPSKNMTADEWKAQKASRIENSQAGKDYRQKQVELERQAKQEEYMAQKREKLEEYKYQRENRRLAQEEAAAREAKHKEVEKQLNETEWAKEARAKEVDQLNGKMERRTVKDWTQQMRLGNGDESQIFAGRNTRKNNMEKANADIDAANQVYIDTGEGTAQRRHNKKTYWAEVKGKGRQTPGGDTSTLGQKGTTAPNGSDASKIAEENATNGFNFDGIADWAKENQLIVAGGLVAGTLLLTDD